MIVRLPQVVGELLSLAMVKLTRIRMADATHLPFFADISANIVL